MSREEAVIVDEARSFLDELFGEGVTIQYRLLTGAFPDGWTDRYLGFVERVSAHYGEESPLPREVLAVVYNASVYCTKRYFDWQRLTGGTNGATEGVVNQVRWAGDRLVLGRYWRRGGPAARHNQTKRWLARYFIPSRLRCASFAPSRFIQTV